ncbi:MAG: hypothetical protein IT428_20950 [Planctomycetaceae bacterium]|nr:hypothetical protein [Planctomycetaceae bacterium]
MTHHTPSEKKPHASTPAPDAAVERPEPETLAIDIRGVLLVGAGLVLLIVVSLVGLWAWLDWRSPTPMTRDDRAENEMPSAALPGEPGVDAHQKARRLEYEAEQEKLLTEYQPVDGDQKVFRIPIRRAMELFVERSKRDAKEEK